MWFYEKLFNFHPLPPNVKSCLYTFYSSQDHAYKKAEVKLYQKTNSKIKQILSGLNFLKMC